MESVRAGIYAASRVVSERIHCTSPHFGHRRGLSVQSWDMAPSMRHNAPVPIPATKVSTWIPNISISVISRSLWLYWQRGEVAELETELLL